jgi:hypothetical protein
VVTGHSQSSLSGNSEFDLLVESVSYCGPYGVVALSVVAVYLNVYVVGH